MKWVPESPIWLAERGKYYDSDKVIARMNRSLTDFIKEVRATRLADFLHIGRLFSLGSFLIV
jgi:hypothetical protein